LKLYFISGHLNTTKPPKKIIILNYWLLEPDRTNAMHNIKTIIPMMVPITDEPVIAPNITKQIKNPITERNNPPRIAPIPIAVFTSSIISPNDDYGFIK
jgi:hypothetical protein